MCACRRLECIAQLESCLCQWEEARVIYKSDGLWSKTAPEPRLVPISHSCSVTVRVWRHCVGGVLCAWSPGDGDSAVVEILSSRKDACWMCSGVLFFPWTESNQAWEVCWVTACILFVRLKMLHQVPTAQTRSTGPVQGLRLDRLPV